MASDGYLLVQWRNDGEWLVGKLNSGEAHWSDYKPIAMQFESQGDFRRWHKEAFGHSVIWSRETIRFVRVRPRKEAA
jgi:hypothetical protein